MKVLMTGSGRSGSWQIRGEQLGRAIGAEVKSHATLADCRAADVIVAVKRIPPDTLAAIRASGRPWVWDIVDHWPQPAGNAWPRERAIARVSQLFAQARPTAVIYPTCRMHSDIGYRGATLYHHARPQQVANPVRENVAAVGYQGATDYLYRWMPALLAECGRRGWAFLLNPAQLADVDIVVALRSGDYAGYAPRHWKSNVKLANAQGTGTPIVCQAECGYTETASGAEIFVERLDDLPGVFDRLAEPALRRELSAKLKTETYAIEEAGRDLLGILHGL